MITMYAYIVAPTSFQRHFNVHNVGIAYLLTLKWRCVRTGKRMQEQQRKGTHSNIDVWRCLVSEIFGHIDVFCLSVDNLQGYGPWQHEEGHQESDQHTKKKSDAQVKFPEVKWTTD